MPRRFPAVNARARPCVAAAADLAAQPMTITSLAIGGR